MKSRDVLDCLLREAHRDLTDVENALSALHRQGVAGYFDKFVLLGTWREELKAEIESLERSIRRLNLLEEMLKK